LKALVIPYIARNYPPPPPRRTDSQRFFSVSVPYKVHIPAPGSSAVALGSGAAALEPGAVGAYCFGGDSVREKEYEPRTNTNLLFDSVDLFVGIRVVCVVRG
jgi:hypothetical protein